MTHRNQNETRGSRQGGRPYEDDGGNRGGRYGRQYDDDSPRGYGASRDTEDMNEWDAGGRGDRMYGASEDNYGSQYQNQNRGQARGQNRNQDQYLGSYPSERGAQYYTGEHPGQYGGQFGQGSSRFGGAYGSEDFRQGSGQRQWAGNRSQYPQPQDYGRQGQRYGGGQFNRAASSPDQGYGYGNYRQQQQYLGSNASGAYGRDFEDEGDFGQSYGGYSPSQGGYGQGYSGYGRGGYGTTPGQNYDTENFGASDTYPGSNYAQGNHGSRGYSQGLSGRGGYGMGSSARGSEGDYGMGQRASQFGKGPKGYTRSDERLKEDISERLMRDHDIDASDIDIEVRNGKVTLTGSLGDRRIKHYVEDLIESVSGVRDIDNRLTVRARGADGGSSFGGQAASTGTTGSRAGSTTAGTTSSTSTPSGSGSPGGSTAGEDGNTPRKN